MRRCIVSVAVLVALIAGAGTALAQNAQISGTFKDQSGGILPGVTVTAKNQASGLTRVAVTEANGQYRLAALTPGVYDVTTELSGFSSESRKDIVLVIDQVAIIDITLKPAAIAETITVAGESPIVDTTKSDVSTSVSTDQIQDLPVACAPLGGPGDAHAGHVAGQHPRLLLPRQRQRRRRRAASTRTASWSTA